MGYAQIAPFEAAFNFGGMGKPDTSVESILKDIPGIADTLYGDPEAQYNTAISGIQDIKPQGGKQLAGAGLVALLSLLAGRKSGYAGVGVPGQAWNQSFEQTDRQRMEREKADVRAKAAPYLQLMNDKGELKRKLGAEVGAGVVKSRMPAPPEHQTPEMKNYNFMMNQGGGAGGPFEKFIQSEKDKTSSPMNESQFKASLLSKKAAGKLSTLEQGVLDSMEKPTAEKALSPGQYLVKAAEEMVAAGKMTKEQAMAEVARIAGSDPEMIKQLIGDRLGGYTPPFAAPGAKGTETIKYDAQGNRVK